MNELVNAICNVSEETSAALTAKQNEMAQIKQGAYNC